MIDSCSRDSADWKKIAPVSIISGYYALYWVMEADAGFPNIGNFTQVPYLQNLFITGLDVWVMILWFGFFLQLYLRSPKNLKKMAGLTLMGLLCPAMFSLIWSTIFGIFEVGTIINLCIAIGSFFLTFCFLREPRLAYVLPFKVLRLSVINSESGIPLFTHTWHAGKELVDEDLYSGMLQGVSMIVTESLNRGNVDEILMDKGVLILQRCQDTRIVFVLAATKSSHTLRDTLKVFADKFCTEFGKYFDNASESSQFEMASVLVAQCFPFIPDE